MQSYTDLNPNEIKQLACRHNLSEEKILQNWRNIVEKDWFIYVYNKEATPTDYQYVTKVNKYSFSHKYSKTKNRNKRDKREQSRNTAKKTRTNRDKDRNRKTKLPTTIYEDPPFPPGNFKLRENITHTTKTYDKDPQTTAMHELSKIQIPRNTILRYFSATPSSPPLGMRACHVSDSEMDGAKSHSSKPPPSPHLTFYPEKMTLFFV